MARSYLTPVTLPSLSLTSPSSASMSDLEQWKTASSSVLGGVNVLGQPYAGSTSPLNYVLGATTAASGDGTKATITTAATHGLAVGDIVVIAAIVPSGYRGTYLVTDVPTTTTFKYLNATTGSQTTAGTVSLPSQLSVTARSKFTVPLIVKAAGADTMMQIWQDSSGSNAAYVDSTGGFNTNSTITALGKADVTASAGTVGYFTSSNSSFTGTIMYMDTPAASGTGWTFLRLRSDTGGTADLKVRIAGDGSIRADGSLTSPAADYAEYFEWEDGNPDSEDRRGITVTIADGKIRPAAEGDVIVGVVSSRPVVVGDAAPNNWSKKYLTDDYGCPVYEDREVWSWKALVDEGEPGVPAFREKEFSFFDDQVPEGVDVPSGKTVTVVPRRILNPEFDKDAEYVPRDERPEWAPVGLVGKLRVRKGQPVSASWIHLREISPSVDQWLVR